MKDKTRIVSLDLETSGIIPGTHVPLSIGAVDMSVDLDGPVISNSFYMQLEWDSLTVTSEALRINGLDIANPPGRDGLFDAKSLPAAEGLQLFAEWLNSHVDGYSEGSIIAMGKNVGSFDLTMLRPVWKNVVGRPWPFSYRSIDLNTLLFTLSELTGLSYSSVRIQVTNYAWNKFSSSKSLSHISKDHHALGDAWWNVFAWQNCLDWLKNLGE